MTDISLVPVEQWSVDDVHPYPFNNKKHPEKHIELLARSIKAQGLIEPVVIDKAGVIISGHGRFEALKRLGKTFVQVRVLRGISDDQASALRIAANKTVSNDYDTDMLSKELTRLNEADFDLGSLGFDDRELSMLLTDVGVIDTDTLVDDLDMAIGAHEADVADSTAAADADQVRLDKVFGFKTVPLRDQKIVMRFMAEIQAKSGKDAAAALVDHMRKALAA